MQTKKALLFGGGVLLIAVLIRQNAVTKIEGKAENVIDKFLNDTGIFSSLGNAFDSVRSFVSAPKTLSETGIGSNSKIAMDGSFQ